MSYQLNLSKTQAWTIMYWNNKNDIFVRSIHPIDLIVDTAYISILYMLKEINLECDLKLNN